MNLNPRQRQYLLAVSASFIGIGLLGSMVWAIVKDVDDPLSSSRNKPIRKTNITTGANEINPKAIWVEQVESEARLTQKKLETLEKMVLESAKKPTNVHDEVEQLKLEIADLKKQIENKSSDQSFSNQEGEVLPLDGHQDGVSGHKPNSIPIQSIKFNLKPQAFQQGKLQKTVENVIPAGAYASAVLLSGVDASTSISSQGDPRPVLMRITDHGNLPRRFKSDLKACHVLGSSYGDISSERVYIRLEKLTCVERQTGEIIETQVAGYVAGEDGKNGVRGVVVDRSGPILRNSLVGGMLSGLSQFLTAEQQRASFPTNILGGGTNALPVGNMIRGSAAQGAGQAMDKYVEFLIKRAEQLQPVIQVSAGREVDIVFQQGTEFGSTSVRDTLQKVRNRSREQIVNRMESEGDSKDWLAPSGGE